ncbi:MAG: PDZ domain-containing protein [Planctomycetes bacterium]|nr:PDZ domain-containing protein [Planctomycetota bacterium]
MKRGLFLSFSFLLLIAPRPALAQQTKSPEIVRLFRSVVEQPSQSTVRVLVAGKDAALGAIVSADGWILSKHSELKGGRITCRMPDGVEVDAELVGFDVPHDLAMLKVAVKGLTPVVWTDSKAAKIGHWVASPGTGPNPVAIGVVSVAARTVKGARFASPGGRPGGYLGIAFDLAFPAVRIEEVFPNTPAQKAGLKAGDQILTFDGEQVQNTDELRGLLSRKKPGDDILLKISRADKESEIKVTLGASPGAKGGKSRGEIQNNMGSRLSERRAGFPVILQHDSVLRPNDCGGPLVNLDGKVLGINIARAGRTESYAIPSEAVRPLLAKLKTRKLQKAPDKQ